MKNLILKTITIAAFIALVLAADGPALLMLPPAAWLILFVGVNYGRQMLGAIEEAWNA